MFPLRLILTLDIKKFCDRCGVIVTEFAYLFSSYLKRTSVGVLCSGDEVQKHGTPALRSSYSRARGRLGRKPDEVTEGGHWWRLWRIFHGKDEHDLWRNLLERSEEEERWCLAKRAVGAGVVFEMPRLAAAHGTEEIGWGSWRDRRRGLWKARLGGVGTGAQALLSLHLWEGLCHCCLSCWRVGSFLLILCPGAFRVSALSDWKAGP